MKIAIIGSDSFDSLEFHLKDELNIQGNETQIFDYIKAFPDKIEFGLSQLSMNYFERKNKNLLQKVLNFKPELVIGVYRHIHPSVVKTIKSKKIKIIHINPDQLTTFQNQQLFVEPYDMYFTKDPFILNFMKNKLNLNVSLYHEAFNPRVHIRPTESYNILEKNIGIDVLCFGNLYPYRNRMLCNLKEKNINLTLYGNLAKYFDLELNDNFQNRAIYGSEKAKILNGSKIVFNNFHYAEIESVNNKFFEITGSGAFQICDYKPILKQLLPIDPKKISFNRIDEAEKLIKYYLRKPEKRYELRDLLQKYFLENYTYKNLIERVLNKI